MPKIMPAYFIDGYQHLEHCRVLAANKVEWKNLVKKWTQLLYAVMGQCPKNGL